MKNNRLYSLDALRGFDMLFIMGLAELITALCRLYPSKLTGLIAFNMHHVPWNGWTQHDTIFPLFLFLAGVSFPFSLAKQKAQGTNSYHIHRKIILRGITLVVLGLIYNGLLQFDFENMRYASVLGRIGLAWMFAALITLHATPKVRIGIIAGILLGYWALLYFFPAPDLVNGAPYTMEGSLVGYIDRLFLPGKLHQQIHDPEGLLSTLPAIATALLGISAGELVKISRKQISSQRKAVYLGLTGIGLLTIGLLWDFVFPINKNLWTSSFVCAVGGYSFLMFSLFYYLIDVRGYRSWTYPLRVIGMNSITIYMAQEIINFSQISNYFLGGLISLVPPDIGPILHSLGYLLFCWLFLWFLYKKQVFLKV